MGGVCVPYLRPSSPYKYLGVRLRLDLKMRDQFRSIMDTCMTRLAKIGNCPASDTQVMTMIAEVVAPAVAYPSPPGHI